MFSHLQIKLLKLLAMLGAGDPTTSEAVYGVLGDVIKRGDSRSTIGNAILYECICTAAAIVPSTPLLHTCAEMTTRFLKVTQKEANLLSRMSAKYCLEMIGLTHGPTLAYKTSRLAYNTVWQTWE